MMGSYRGPSDVGSFFASFQAIKETQKMIENQETGNDCPTLIHVPHASIVMPEKYISDYRAEVINSELLMMTDWYCDELFDLGREMIRFPISRLVCDVERFRDDREETMAAVGMGWYYTRCSDGAVLRRDSPAHKNEILKKYYDPHHTEFEKAVSSRLSAFGRCLIIDGHSFFPEALPYEPDRTKERPDFCIGTDSFHTPPQLTGVCVSFLESKGYSVRINAPFSGSIVPIKYYAKDARVSSVMLEVNRRLYMDKRAKKNSGFSCVKETLEELLPMLENTILDTAGAQ